MTGFVDGRPSDDAADLLSRRETGRGRGDGLPAPLRARFLAKPRFDLGEVGISDQGCLRTRAPAKVNLTLQVLGRRADGYHELESLVAFAGAADLLELRPGPDLGLTVEGPTAGAAGPTGDNLVLKAARGLAGRLPGLKLGTFHLTKRLPAAAGIGGGSSDAAGALRLLARLNGLPADHPAVIEAARETGADVPVCLDPRARMMRGAGEEVGSALSLLPLAALLINPGVAVPTGAVFQRLGLAPGDAMPEREPRRVRHDQGPTTDAILATIRSLSNDLEAPALALAPVIGVALDRLRGADGCRLARMSGSGATVFGLFDDCHAAARAASAVRAEQPRWWVKPTLLR
ncbi:4-(cytidine 5'-diphospho)-2-C-methyl-D-erythritol kinase [Enterovirga rhinocerotis]|uniref:4-diphosphocytidyl-2-C-methyl-D-erythritol kinase n=1 Tax=Enterovirga rhinocerotis TaxID=1339210 RepID=A0A4V3DYT1_9HYPH|nr:4-(cytidine 5'-diphospho)-2-C-methyl-D-erythritol kinase [Enterovirga rhinocerotis]TDR93789.1 4-diphosphocytidyl-2-C-methyl-D-erythritol kinase [Enterovirga rhinocerotis]